MTHFTKVVSLFLLLVTSETLRSQNETKKWYFGQNAGLDFMTSPPTILTNGALNTVEGCASISDAAGNILFYTDGVTVYNQNHVAMANGTGLTGNSSSTQSGVIVKQPGNSTIYYVITQGSFTPGLCYSIVDMSLAPPNGSVTTKNVPLFNTGTEKLTSVKHCNGVDVWVLSHDNNSNTFRAYLITSTGINTAAVTSSVGTGGTQMLGYLKASPTGKKIGNAIWNQGIFEVLDFDNSTGVVTNPVVLGTGFTYAYGCEFSPDGSKFYGGKEQSTLIFQWDLCAGSATAIAASQNTVGTATGAIEIGAFQLGPDGKMYVARYNSQSLGVINNPNVYGTGCNFVNMAQTTGTSTCLLGLPNFISSFFKPALPPFTYTVNCSTASFNLPISPTVNIGCSAFGNTVTTQLWTFGDPASGTTNSSTVSNPSHIYSAAGTYTVRLVLYNQCSSDTLNLPVTVTSAAPNLAVAGTFTICKGEKRIYTASGAGSYTWSGNVTTTTISLSPTVTTTYSVTGTGTNSCKGSKTFTVTVSKCTSIDQAVAEESQLNIYPNPMQNTLYVETGTKIRLTLLNQTGTVVFESIFESGKHSIDMSNYSGGIYTVRSVNGKGVKTMRMVKTE